MQAPKHDKQESKSWYTGTTLTLAVACLEMWDVSKHETCLRCDFFHLCKPPSFVTGAIATYIPWAPLPELASHQPMWPLTGLLTDLLTGLLTRPWVALVRSCLTQTCNAQPSWLLLRLRATDCVVGDSSSRPPFPDMDDCVRSQGNIVVQHILQSQIDHN